MQQLRAMYVGPVALYVIVSPLGLGLDRAYEIYKMCMRDFEIAQIDKWRRTGTRTTCDIFSVT